MRCCDPSTRAATLLRVPGEVAVALSDGTRQQTTAAVPWGEAVVLLLSPGPLAEELRRGPRADTGLEVVQRTAVRGGTQEHGRLNLLGHLRVVPAGGRRQIALQLWDANPTERLLDAVADDGWLLAFLDATEACWILSRGAFPLPVAEILRAQPDRVLQSSLVLCQHLNEDHPAVAEWLAGGPAVFSEVDRDGATLLVDDHDGNGTGVLRIPWPQRCDDLDELQQVLRCLPAEVRTRRG